MEKYYSEFYQDTWIYWADKIIADYVEIYEKFKTSVFNAINIYCKAWIIWRKVILSNHNNEICSFSFTKRSYRITFFAIKDSDKMEIVVYDVRFDKI